MILFLEDFNRVYFYVFTKLKLAFKVIYRSHSQGLGSVNGSIRLGLFEIKKTKIYDPKYKSV